MCFYFASRHNVNDHKSLLTIDFLKSTKKFITKMHNNLCAHLMKLIKCFSILCTRLHFVHLNLSFKVDFFFVSFLKLLPLFYFVCNYFAMTAKKMKKKIRSCLFGKMSSFILYIRWYLLKHIVFVIMLTDFIIYGFICHSSFWQIISWKLYAQSNSLPFWVLNDEHQPIK